MTFPGTSCPEKSLTICVACSPRNPQKSRDSRPHVRRSEFVQILWTLRIAAPGYVLLFIKDPGFEFDRSDFEPISRVGGEGELVRADADARGHRLKRGPGELLVV